MAVLLFCEHPPRLKLGGDLTSDEKIGFEIALRAVRAHSTIATNAGQDGGIVCEKVSTKKGTLVTTL